MGLTLESFRRHGFEVVTVSQREVKKMPKLNRGSLKPNPKKEQDSHPDYKGSVNIDGKEYWLSGWKNVGDEGPWVGLSFQPKEERVAAASSSGEIDF